MSSEFLPNVSKVPIQLGIGACGACLMSQIISYLKSKPLGFQTLLDGIYIQLMECWILEGTLIIIGSILATVDDLHWVLAWIFGFGLYLALILSAIHLIVCLMFQIFLIWYQDKIEEFEDKNVLRWIRIVEAIIIAFLGVALYASSNIPHIVYILQKVQVEAVPAPFLILVSLAWGSSFLKLIFKIFVYCSVTNDSNNLLTLRAILTLFCTFNLPLIDPIMAIFGTNLTMAHIFPLLYCTLKCVIIPLDILLSNSKLKKFIKIKTLILLSMIKSFCWFILVCIIKIVRCFLSVRTFFTNNQIAPVDVVE